MINSTSLNEAHYNSRTQVTLPLAIQHWEMSWDTQVTQ
jgi:hypothetical protein